MWKHIHNVMGRNDEERRKETNGWRSLEAGSVCSIFQSPIIWGLGKGHRTSRLPTSTAPPKNLKKNLQNLYQKNSRINTKNPEKYVFFYMYSKMYIIGRFSSPCHNSGCLVVWAVGLSPPRVPLREKVGHKCKSLWKFICDAYTYMGNIDEFTTTVHVESGINIKSHLLEKSIL